MCGRVLSLVVGVTRPATRLVCGIETSMCVDDVPVFAWFSLINQAASS
jgi:hypothetical protein